MADVTKIAIIADASGARREIKLTTEELVKLANSGKMADSSLRQMGTGPAVQSINRVTQAMKQMQEVSRANAMASAIRASDPFQQQAAGIVKMEQAAQKAIPGLGRLQNQIGNLSFALAGIPGPMGNVAQAMGAFAIGGVAAVAIIAGIGAIAFAFKKLTADTNAAMNAFEKFNGSSEAALRARIAQLQSREANLAGGREATGLGYGDRGFDATLTASIRRNKELERTRTLMNELALELRKVESAKAAEEMERLSKVVLDLSDPVGDLIRDMDNAVGQGLKDYARSLADAATEAEKFRKAFSDPITGAFSIPEADLQNIADGIKQTADALEDAAEKAKRMKDALKGMVIGAGVGLLDRALPGAGGVVSGAMAGFQAAGPMGAAIGGGMALVDMLFGMADSAKQAREQFRQFTLQMQDFIQSEKEALGIVSGLDAATGRVNRQYAENRKALEQAIAGLTAMNTAADGAFFTKERQAQIEALKLELSQLNPLEAQRADLLRRQQGEIERLSALDNEVLRARIAGNTEEAEALERSIAHQREMNALIEANGSETERRLLTEKHFLEDLAVKADKIRERIASLTGTIESLQAFRNGLTISEQSGLSPTDRLANARAQYEGILRTARGGVKIPGLDGTEDIFFSQQEQQAAAAQLPQAAQALLDLSRMVNASGVGFQSDFQKILTDTQGLINQFIDMRSVEELMLDELKRIATATEITARAGDGEEAPRPPDFPRFGKGGRPGLTDGGGSSSGANESTSTTNAVLAEGFTTLVSETRANTQAIEELARRMETGLAARAN